MRRLDYAGATALITGASKGIGEELARALAARGARLVLVARSATRLDEVAEQLRARGADRVDVIAADLFNRETARSVTEELDARGLTVDILFNNAGLGAVGPFLDRPLAHDLGSVDLNITAILGLTHELGGRMKQRGAGGIINVASAAAFQPMPYQASYGASKAYVLSFTEALAEELRGSGVRVMVAHPGPVKTGFFDSTTARIDPRAVSPAQIATRILDDFVRGRSTSFPGRFSDRATALVPRLLPRAVIARVVGNLNRKNGYDHVEDVTPSSPTHRVQR